MSVDGAGELALLRSTLDALTVGVIVRDAEGAEVVRNSVARRLTGDYQADALVRSVIAQVMTAADTGRYRRKVLELNAPTARVFAISARKLPEGSAVLIEDTTERQRLDRVKRDFVANVSHELRTPVGAIVLLSETLQDETNAGSIALLQTHIADEARRARRLVDSLLLLSRVEGVRPEAGSYADLRAVATDAMGAMSTVAADAGIELVLVESGGPLLVTGEPDSLVSAVGNLLENAVKYTEGGLPVTLRLGRTDTEAVLQVLDSGIGIPAKDVGRIFERFYRVDRARSRGTGGAGLGLAIVRHIVESAGGEIGVESREGEGSTFTVTLPLASSGSATDE